MLHEFLFQEHGCYAVAKQGTAADPVAATALYTEGKKHLI
jgi:hypothetical protein